MKLTEPSVTAQVTLQTRVLTEEIYTKYQGINYIELVKENNPELDLSMAEKRPTLDSLNEMLTRLKIVEPDPKLKSPELVKEQPRIQERKSI
ncbi:hypothetical protein AYI69_g8365 [Smittium culicis]|uniref:Uncharacterized protein n=1 Tax=Smittium culicis TaxID=133412 RepID=A0A1R1XK55_9FUNG|nr:hypothetical protein AYI69_g8365 [Smittium culicis]